MMRINRPAILLLLVALIIAVGTLSPGWITASASGKLQASTAKKKCVTKKVHGKKKRVCRQVASPSPTPVPTPTSLHLIDASGYVWLDGVGNIFVSSGAGSNGRVSKLSRTGALLATFQSDLDGASGLAVDAQGNLYVADIGSDRIVKFSSTGKQVATIGTYMNVPGELSAPSGIGLDGTGHLYVADSNNSRLQEFTLDGQFVQSWGTYGAEVGQFDRPLDVAVGGQGNLFVVDFNNNRVQVFSPSGTVVTTWGTQGSGPGQFDHPKGLSLDTSGNVYVADTGNRRIQKFSADGSPLLQWSTGDYEPVSTGVDSSGNVYVTEDSPGGTTGYGLAKYAPDGRLLSVWR